jgi:hypothetical protein
VSIPAPGVIWRIIEAVSRPIDQPVGPIHLDTADADWLHAHLMDIAMKPTPLGPGAPAENPNHYIWVAVDVNMRLLTQITKKPSLKVALFDVANFWQMKRRDVEECERAVRDVAKRLVTTTNYGRLAKLIKLNRDNYLARANRKPRAARRQSRAKRKRVKKST